MYRMNQRGGHSHDLGKLPLSGKYLFMIIALIALFNGILYYSAQSRHVLPHSLTESEKRVQRDLPLLFHDEAIHRLEGGLMKGDLSKNDGSGGEVRGQAANAADEVAKKLSSSIHRGTAALQSTAQLLHLTKADTETKVSTTKVAQDSVQKSDFRPIYKDSCHLEAHADYDGKCSVVRWGSDHIQPSADQCCAACRAAQGCNVWVYCHNPNGCGEGRKKGECWLKRCEDLDPVKPSGRRGRGLPWTSGAVYTEAQFHAAWDRVKEEKAKFESYLAHLRDDERLPMVYMDVSIKKVPLGRITIVLFTDISPRAAENFRQFFTGEKPGVVPPGHEGAGKPYTLKGAYFYRIVDQFIDQTGAGTESVFGGKFLDDPGGLRLKHDRKGLLSCANLGPNTTTSHFSIMVNPAPHLNGHYSIFGQVVDGFDIVDAINILSVGKKQNTAGTEEEVLIYDVGQIRKGTLKPDLNKF